MSTEPSQAQPRSRHEIREARIRAQQDLLSTGQVPLITRREIRRQRAEAEALRQAIAAGEITAEEARAIQEGDLFVISPTMGQDVAPAAAGAETVPAETVSTEVAGSSSKHGAEPDEDGVAASAGDETVESVAVQDPVVEAVTPVAEPEAEPVAVNPAGAEPEAAAEVVAEVEDVTEQAPAPEGAEEEPESSTQSVTRRPVLRVPAAQGVRQLDASTGEISGIIPVDESFTGIETPQWRALVPDEDGAVTDSPAQDAPAADGEAVPEASDLHELLAQEPADEAGKQDSPMVRRLAVALMVLVVLLVLATVLWFVLGRSGSAQSVGVLGQVLDAVVERGAGLIAGA